MIILLKEDLKIDMQSYLNKIIIKIKKTYN